MIITGPYEVGHRDVHCSKMGPLGHSLIIILYRTPAGTQKTPGSTQRSLLIRMWYSTGTEGAHRMSYQHGCPSYWSFTYQNGNGSLCHWSIIIIVEQKQKVLPKVILLVVIVPMEMEKAAMAGVGGSNGQWWQTLGVEGLLEGVGPKRMS